MNGMSDTFLLTTLGSMGAVTALGLLFGRGRQGGATAFSLNGRRAGTGAVAGAIMGSAVGGGATIGTAQLAFQYGLVAWCFMLGIGLGLLLLAMLFAVPLRRSGLETVPQYLQLCYGRAAGPIVSLISCCGIFFACAASVLPGMELAAAFFHLSRPAAAALLVLLLALYISVGGQKSAGISGILKAGLLWVAMGACALPAAAALGCFGGSTASLPALPRGSWSLLSRGWGYLFSCLGATAMGMMTAQMYIQAVYSAADTRTARRGAILGAALAVPVGLMSTLIGMYMRAKQPDIAPIFALPAFLLQEVPAWLGGLAMGGIVLSVVSSAAAQALAVGTLAARDWGAGLCGLRGERALLGVNRAALLLFAVLVALFCLCHADADILSWNYLSMALRGGGIFLPLALGVQLRGHPLLRRLNTRWVMVSMLLSTAASLFAATQLHMPPTAVGLGTAAAVLLAGWAVSRD